MFLRTILIAFFLIYSLTDGQANPFALNDTIKVFKGNRQEWTIRNNNEVILEIIRLKDGVKDGIQEKYHLNGKKSEEATYVNGFLNGKKTGYDINGNIISIINYKYYPEKKRSMPNGTFETYQNKKLMSKGTFKDSLKSGLYEEYHSSGSKKTECNYDQDLKTGLSRHFNATGNLTGEMYYSIRTENGKRISVLHGISKSYDYQGNLTEEGSYNEGKKEGVWLNYNGGKLQKSSTWKNNLQNGEVIEYSNDLIKKRFFYYQEFNDDGVILKNIYDGQLIEYNGKGQVIRKENYKKGKKHGLFEEFYDDGQYKSKSEYLNGLQTGKYENWDSKGNKTFEINMKIIVSEGIEKSVKHGKELRWENGKLTYEVNYENDAINGKTNTYYPNGILKQVYSSKDGRYDGKVLEYYENGKLKSEQTFKSIKDYSGNPKTIQTGWRIEYDKDGSYLNRYFHDSIGEISIYMNYYKGNPMNITYKDLLSLNFFPDGKLLSLQELGSHYAGCFSIYYYWNNKVRKLKVQNPVLDIVNYIDFSDKGEPIYSYSDLHHNPEDKRLDEKTMQKYAKLIEPDLPNHKFFTDSVKNGKYQLFYSNGKLMAEYNFKNDFPDGKFLFYDPVSSDTLAYSEYAEGVKIGYYVYKFGGKTLYKRGRIYENGQSAWTENYQPNGIPTSKTTFDRTGKRIINVEYFENGKIKYSNNEETGEYASYDKEGLLHTETKMIDPVRKFKVHTENYPGTSTLKSRYYTLNNIRDSIWENYFKDGKLQFRYTYKNGKKNGPGIQYNEKGELVHKGNFVEDKQDGIFEVTTNGKSETVYYENGNLKVLPSTVVCSCQDTKESLSGTTFAPPVDQLLSYKRLKMFLPDNIIPEDSTSFSKIFYTALQTSSGNSSGFFSMNLMMFQTHYFKIPSDEQIKIILNPCHTKGYRSRLETRANISYSDDNETYLQFYPERIALEFPKSPIKDMADKTMSFRAYFDTKEVAIERQKKLEIKLESDAKACHSPGIINNFLKVNISESLPLLFKNPKEAIGASVSKLNLSEDELNSFFGLWVKKAECSFPIQIDSKEYILQSVSNFMLVGGIYVAGEITIDCTMDGNYIMVKSEKEKVKLTIDELKTLWLDKGFTKLSVKLNDEKNKIVVTFFAD